MKRIYLTILIVLNSCTFKNPVQINIDTAESYYWYNNAKIPLKFNPLETFILFTESAKIDSAIQGTVQHSILGEGLVPYTTNPARRNLRWSRLKSSEVVLVKKEDILYQAPSFFNTAEEVVTLSNVFYVKLKQEGDITILDKMAADAGIEIIGSDGSTSLWYMLACTNKSKGNTLEMANQFFESGAYLASEPELLIDN
jgi:hypothetical protein